MARETSHYDFEKIEFAFSKLYFNQQIKKKFSNLLPL